MSEQKIIIEKMKDLVEQEKFNIISNDNKIFLVDFDEEMAKLGYEIYQVADAYTWAKNWLKAKYMINYKTAGIKATKLAAHVFIKEDGGIFLRLFAFKKGSNSHNTQEMARSVIAPRREYIENAPAYIKELFTQNSDCDHTHENANGFCWRLDTYTIDNKVYEKCIGHGFNFPNPAMEHLPDYINLLAELNSKTKP